MVMELTPIQVANTPELFAEHFLKILDKRKKLVPLRWNRAQKDFHSKRTGRDLILKARQLGFSSYVQGELFHRSVTRTTTSITLSHDADTTAKLRLMADRFYENCKMGDIQPTRKYANASLTTYPEFDSACTIGTAGNVTIGRGDTYTDFHGSEVAFWKDAESIIAGAMQGGNPDVILESTPNGAQGYFYDLCMEALSGESVWTLHFYPWWWDDAYQLPLKDDEKIKYTNEEKKLVEKQNLTPEQIKWRRNKKKELKELFEQEYPEDPITCFLTSGNSYFFTGIDADTIESIFTAPDNAKYNPEHEYFAGLDWGQSSDFTDMPVLNATDKVMSDLLHINKLAWKEQRKRVKSTLLTKWSHIVCTNGHLIIGILGNDGMIYKKCPKCDGNIVTIKKPKAGVEMNSIGSVNFEELVNDELDVIPFNTTNETKADICSDLYEAIHTNRWKLLDNPLVRHQMKIFVSKQLPSGIWRLAADGEGHDDIVMGLAIAKWTVLASKMQIF